MDKEEYLELMESHRWQPTGDHALFKCQCGAKRINYTDGAGGPRVAGQLVCPIFSEEADLIDLLRAIRAETVPKVGHPDPEALQDTWNEVFERLGAD